MDSFFKLLDDLIRPGNRAFLVAFVVIALAMALFIGLLGWAMVRKGQFNVSRRFGHLWIHLTGGPDDPKVQPRGFRRLLYVKVNLLSNQKVQKTPLYERVVGRLDGTGRTVQVFDEAVYYTLKLFPEKRKLGPELDVSSSVVDPRIVIPWQTQLDFHIDDARNVPQLADIEAKEDSDTMLTVSHFLNGFQANHHVDTYADENAESLRLVVDFSSIPRARERITLDPNRVQLLRDHQPVDTDLTHNDCGDSVYMAHCKDARKGDTLRMDFTFNNWDTSLP